MNDLLLSIDATMKKLVAEARTRGTAMCGVWPLIVDVDIVKGMPVWYLDGDKATEVQVREAWAKVRAARAPKPVQSIAQRV